MPLTGVSAAAAGWGPAWGGGKQGWEPPRSTPCMSLTAIHCSDSWIKLEQNEDWGLERNRSINSFNFYPTIIDNDVGKCKNKFGKLGIKDKGQDPALAMLCMVGHSSLLYHVRKHCLLFLDASHLSFDSIQAILDYMTTHHLARLPWFQQPFPSQHK